MEIKDFIKNLADQYDDVELQEFAPETKFKEFDEYSSLTALSIIAMVDDEYGVTLKGEYNQEIKGETNVEIIPVIA